MEKVIKIGKQEIKLNNNIAWTMEYRDQFNKDILPVILPAVATLMESVSTVVAGAGEQISVKTIAEALEGRAIDVLLPMYQMEFNDIAINVTWAMAKAADEDILPPKQWVKQFEVFPLDVVIPEIAELALKGFTSSKNLKRLKAMLKGLQPQLSMTLSSQELNED